MVVLHNQSGLCFKQAVEDHVEPVTHIRTDGYSCNSMLHGLGPLNMDTIGKNYSEDGPLKNVDRVISLAKRYLLGTFHQYCSGPHLQRFLNEYRFNRRYQWCQLVSRVISACALSARCRMVQYREAQACCILTTSYSMASTEYSGIKPFLKIFILDMLTMLCEITHICGVEGHHMKRFIGLCASVLTALFCSSALCARSPIPDSAYEDAILYRGNHSVLLYSMQNQPIKVDSRPSFFLLVSQGTGFLANFDYGNRPIGVNGTPDGSAALNVAHDLDENTAWTQLTEDGAKKLWGEPSKRTARPILTTFDVLGKFNEERNLYHVDLNFDKSSNVFGYRIRGIGIGNAKWIRFNDGKFSLSSS